VAKSPERILLAVDGESHTNEAVYRALDMAVGLGMTLNPVHVRDPYLKQFYTEIYAQGREEYLEHVQVCLEEKAETADELFDSTATEYLEKRHEGKKPDWDFDVLDGDPVEQLKAHIERGEYSMLVLGRRHRTKFRALKSRDLAERLLSAGCTVPMLIVPAPEGDGDGW